MAQANSDSTVGAHTVTDTTISGATIDNSTQGYTIEITITPNDASADVYLYACSLIYTVTIPFP